MTITPHTHIYVRKQLLTFHNNDIHKNIVARRRRVQRLGLRPYRHWAYARTDTVSQRSTDTGLTPAQNTKTGLTPVQTRLHILGDSCPNTTPGLTPEQLHTTLQWTYCPHEYIHQDWCTTHVKQKHIKGTSHTGHSNKAT